MYLLLSQPDQQKNKIGYHNRVPSYLELFIVATLSVSIAVIFFNAPRWTRAFGEAGFGGLLLWAIYHKRKPANPIPKSLIIMSVLYILSYVINVFMSPDPTWEHVNIRKYIYIIIGGLLFAFPVKDEYRTFMITVFFTSAAIAGAAGIMQYFNGGIGSRAQGYSGNPLHYAGLLAFVCGTAVIMLFIRNRNHFKSKRGVAFLSVVATLTFFGILFSQSRGVWVALFVASTVTLVLYDRKKSLIFLFCIIMILSVVFYYSTELRGRAVMIFTSIYHEDPTVSRSTTTRLELWKGALLIFKEHPLLGIGTGNFELGINRLVQAKILKETPTMVHAHNIFLQALATRGVVGFLTTLGLFIALIQWGLEETRNHDGVGGYIIIISTTFTIMSGLTENNIEFTKFLAAYCFTIGLFGPLKKLKDNSVKSAF